MPHPRLGTPVPWGALRLPRCSPHCQPHERPAGWSSGPQARRLPRPPTPARRTGPLRCSPAPSGGPGQGHSLDSGKTHADSPHPPLAPPSPGPHPPTCQLTPPVPRGRMATAGSGQARRCRISSRAASTQPTVPSPPHTSTRKQGTWENTWNLAAGRQDVSRHWPRPRTSRAGGHPRGRSGHSSSPPRVPLRVLTHRTPTCSCWPGGRHGQVPLLAGSPGQRPPVGQLKDLVGIEQLPETAEQVAALEASASGVHKHQQGAAVWGQLQVLTDGTALGRAGRTPRDRAGPPPARGLAVVAPAPQPTCLSQSGAGPSRGRPRGHPTSPLPAQAASHNRRGAHRPLGGGAGRHWPAWSSEHIGHATAATPRVLRPCPPPDPRGPGA